MGLYCKISIAIFYVFFYIIYLLCQTKKQKKFKLFSFKRYFRYLKILFNLKVIKIIVIFSIIANTNVLIQNKKYQTLYKNLEEKICNIEGVVIAKQEDKCKIKVLTKKYKNTYLYIYTSKANNLEYGDKIQVIGIFNKTKTRSNYKGFDYFSYLKTIKIYGSINADNIKIISKGEGNIIIKYINIIVQKIQKRINTSNLIDDQKSIVKGILIGDISDISDEVLGEFSQSSILHILSVSGMNIVYIIIMSNFIFNRLIGKHYTKIITSIIILLYMGIVNFTPSVVRAGIAGIMLTLSNFFYRKNDTWQTLSIALFIILIYNPFSIQNVGLNLSFAGTMGILIFQKNLKNIVYEYLDKKNRKATRKNQKIRKKFIYILNSKLGKSLIDAILITICATVAIIPILAFTFNNINVSSLIISVLSSFIIGPIMIFCFLFIFLKFSFIENILKILLNILINMAKWGSNLPLSQIYVVTPSLFSILIYYILLIVGNFIISIKLEKNPNMFQNRIKNLINVFKYKVKYIKNKIILALCIISLIFFIISIIPKNLKIYFVDVGQGDCTLIVTPKNKTILIDGGGSEFSDFNVGQKTLLPYLLDRKILKIDYIIISHFDTDHVRPDYFILCKTLK